MEPYIEYSGKIIRKHKRFGGVWYDVRLKPDCFLRTDGWAVCAGFGSVCIGKSYVSPPSCLSWGYFGTGPRMLAALMLYYAKYPSMAGKNPDVHGKMDWLRKHTDNFTREVIANLPEEWTLQVTEIQDWIRKQETKD